MLTSICRRGVSITSSSPVIIAATIVSWTISITVWPVYKDDVVCRSNKDVYKRHYKTWQMSSHLYNNSAYFFNV